MSKKILEDVKFNNKDLQRPKEKVLFNGVISEEKNSNLSTLKSESEIKVKPVEVNIKNSSKYDFLNKLNRKTSSFPQRMTQNPRMPRKYKSINSFLIFLLVISVAIGIFYLVSN